MARTMEFILTIEKPMKPVKFSVPVNQPVVLSKASDIRSAIRSVLDDGASKRIVMVAFVGTGAEEYLPAPSGLEIICWDKEGCTDPDTIRELRERNVSVYFAANLHMKVYWSEHRGAVIGSSNLSGNGLGDEGHFEAVALLPPGFVDIEQLKSGLDIRPVTPSLLRSLDRRTRKCRARNNGKMVFRAAKSRKGKQTFDQWYLSKDRKEWKLFVSSECLKKIPQVAAKTLHTRGYSECKEYWIGTRATSEPYEWLLSVDTNRNGLGIYWSCADFSVRMPEEDPEYDSNFPMVSVQCKESYKYGMVPFSVSEMKFKRALRKFLKDNKVETSEDGVRFNPSGALNSDQLSELLECYLSEK